MNTIYWTQKATKQLLKVGQKSDRVAITNAVKKLTSWPNCTGDIKRLQAREDCRLRVGNYRVIFAIDQENQPVIVQINQVEKRDERTY